MANGSDYANVNGDLSLLIQEKSPELISTMFSAAPSLAAIVGISGNKSDAIFGIGNPKSDTILGGAVISPSKVREMMQIGTYSPLIHSVFQNDSHRVAWRGATNIPSAHSGSNATFTITVSNGVVTAVAVAGAGTGYSGSAPTLKLVDAVGSSGYGCSLECTLSSDGIGSVTVKSGGYGYAASGTSIITYVGNSAGERFSRPLFKFAMLENVMYIHQDDIDAAKQMVLYSSQASKDEASLSLVNDAIKDAVGSQTENLHDDFTTGIPTDETTTRWDKAYGLLAAIDDSTYNPNYAEVDRSLAANWWWRSKVDTTARSATFQQIVDDAQLKKGLAFKGTVPTLYLTDPMLMAKWRGEMTANTQEVNLAENGELRKLGQYGFKLPALRYGGSYAVADQKIPQGTVLAINPNSFAIAFRTGKKLQPTAMYEQEGQSGGIRGKKFFVRTEWMPMCVAPALNAKYTAIQL